MANRTIRILDVGCGSGRLMGFLHQTLGRLFENTAIEVFGFDVSDSKVQHSHFFSSVKETLTHFDPGVDWHSRLALVTSDANWPYADHSFDFVISNQVFEHVRDHQHMLRNLSRVLRPDGLSVHVFPMHNCWIEWHTKIPFAHWIRNSDLLQRYIAVASMLGAGTWRRYCKVAAPITVELYATMNRDFLLLETNYVSESDIARLAQPLGLKYAFRYTENLYLNKLRTLLGLSPSYNLSPRTGFLHWLLVRILKRVSSVTLVLEKDNSYFNCDLHNPVSTSS